MYLVKFKAFCFDMIMDENDPTVHTQSIEATWGSIKRLMKKLLGLGLGTS